MLTHTINDPEKIGEAKWGAKYREYREIWKAANQKEYLGEVPPFVILDTIDACNLNCIICHQRGRVRTGERLPVERVKELIGNAAPKGLYSINLSAMAEPYMAPDILLELTDHCRASGLMDIMIHTNLQLPDEALLKETFEAGLTHFCVSIDAVEPDTYKHVRGGDFDLLLERLKYLKSLKDSTGYPIIRVSAVPMEENKEELPRFFEFWGQYADVAEIQGYRADPAHASKGNIATRKKSSCAQPWTRLMLWPTGEVTYCSSKEVYSSEVTILGNYLEDGLELSDYWQGDKLKALRGHFDSGNLEQIPPCKDCHDRSYIFEPEF